MNRDYTLKDYRQLVVGVDTQVPLSDGTYVTAVNFDNAATTPPFYEVIKEIMNFAPWYSSIHRGRGYKSNLSSEIYENARETVRKFVHADKDCDVVVFTKNTTEAVNAASHAVREDAGGRDVVLSTWMEHAANDLPWRERFTVDYAEIDSNGRLIPEDLEDKLKKYGERVRLVTVTGASNVTGYVNPVYDIARMAHRYGAEILVDGAQLIPHAAFDMKPAGSPEHIDYLAFSAHKMFAPFGTGVLIGPKKTFERGEPFCKGGGAVKLVTHQWAQWEEPSQKNEAGTPDLMGVVALSAAIKVLESIDMKQVYELEEKLFDYTFEQMKHVPGVRFYCHRNPGEKRIGVVPFNLEGIPHYMLAAILSYEAGIAVRNGFFCSHPYCQRLLGLNSDVLKYYHDHPAEPKQGIVRVSFGLYNRYDEVDRLIYALHTITRNKEFYLNKYSSRISQNKIAFDV